MAMAHQTRVRRKPTGNNEEKENQVDIDKASGQTTIIEVLKKELMLAEAKLKICEEELASNQMMYSLSLREKDKELASLRLELNRTMKSVKHDNDHPNTKTPTATVKDKLRGKMIKKAKTSVGLLKCDAPNCGKTFSMITGLCRHKNTIHATRKYLCPVCPHKSKRKDALVQHMLGIHNANSDQLRHLGDRRKNNGRRPRPSRSSTASGMS